MHTFHRRNVPVGKLPWWNLPGGIFRGEIFRGGIFRSPSRQAARHVARSPNSLPTITALPAPVTWAMSHAVASLEGRRFVFGLLIRMATFFLYTFYMDQETFDHAIIQLKNSRENFEICLGKKLITSLYVSKVFYENKFYFFLFF